MLTTSERATAPIVAFLDERIGQLLAEIERTEVWQTITHPDTSPDLVRSMMRELYREIASYQPHVIEAAVVSIGQMPRSMPVRMVKAMLRHQAEEFDHGEMAVRDYVALGGDEALARNPHAISHASYTVSAVWWMIAKMRDPFEYLGALYPFEGLTPIVSARVKAILAAKAYPSDALEYIEFHSTEDIKHANLIKALIAETVARYPEAEASIRRGMERFLSVYPIPVWTAAYERARQQAGQGVASSVGPKAANRQGRRRVAA